MSPVLAQRPCRAPGCPSLTDTGFCTAHQDRAGWGSDRFRGSASQRGYGYEWQKLRKRVLARDFYLCQLCLKNGKPVPANQVDHIVPKAHGGTDEESNLQSLCRDCHAAKTARERLT